MRIAAIIFAFAAGVAAGYFGINAIVNRRQEKEVPFKYETFKDLKENKDKEEPKTAEEALESYREVSEDPEEVEFVKNPVHCKLISLKEFNSPKRQEWNKVYLTYIPDTDMLTDERNVEYNGPGTFAPIYAEVIGVVKVKGAAYVENAEIKTVYEVAHDE